MVVSSRAIVAVGLGLAGLAVLVGPSLGQDKAVRQASSRPAAPSPPTFGTVDMSAVFKGYDKVKVNAEEFRAAATAKKAELTKLMQGMQQESEVMAKLTPGSLDFKKHENAMTEMKAKVEAQREQAERDFTLREAEMLATLYKEIQAMVGAVAQYKGLTYILRVSNDPVTGSDPRSAMAAIDRTVVYADAANDITKDVITFLNYEYKRAGGVLPKATSAVTPAAGVKPNGN